MLSRILSTNDDDFEVDYENLNNLENNYINRDLVVLDPYHSDLNLNISSLDRLTAESLTQDGFAFMVASGRATHGCNSGKVGFELKVLEILDVSDSKLEETFTFEIRVGFSTSRSNCRLGESPESFGFCQNAKKVHNGQFIKYGRDFGRPNDVIGALVDFDSAEVSFTLNGQYLGVAFNFPESWTAEGHEGTMPALVPHVTVKNVRFRVNFTRQDPNSSWSGLPEDYLYFNEIDPYNRYRNPAPPSSKEECTVLCMIGLPGSGKSTWAREFMRYQTEEQWFVLSANSILDQMKVQGVPRRKLYTGRWDMIMGAVIKCLNRLILLACRMRRNYILDMTNCYAAPRRKKMTPFQGFRRIAVVMVPSLEDYANRCHQQMMQEGKQMPSDAILEMKACFSLPKEDETDLFDEVRFVELQRDEAQRAVEFYNEEGKAFKPKERKRRGDWQQEELPAELLKKYRNPTTMHTSAPTSTMKPAVVSTPDDKQRAPNERPAWLAAGIPGAIPSGAFPHILQTSANAINPATIAAAAAVATAAVDAFRTVTSAPGPFTPRAGWPASWPQALRRGSVPSTAASTFTATPSIFQTATTIPNNSLFPPS